LARDVVAAALPHATLFDSAEAVARQTVRRLGPAAEPGTGEVRVLLSGRPGTLPPAALAYPAGRALAGSGRDTVGL
jgi:glutamate racemase